MAVLRDDQNQNPQQSTPTPALDLGNSPQQSNFQQTGDIFGWDALQTGVFGAPINDTQGAVVLVKAIEAFNNQLPHVMETAKNTYHAEVIRLDTETHNQLSVSIIVIATYAKGSPDKGVAYQPILVDATNEVTQQSVVQEFNGQPVEILRLTSNSYSPRQQQVVEQVIRATIPRAGKLFQADPVTLPREFELDNPSATMRFVANSVRCTVAILSSKQIDWDDLNLVNVAGDKTLSTRIRFAQADEQLRDETNLPVRSDIRVALTTVSNQNQWGRQNTQEPVRPISLAENAGFMDLVFTGRQEQMYGMMQAPHRPPYVGQFILTRLNMNRVPSTGGQLLGLASVLGSYQNGVAMASLFPNRQLKQDVIDYNDIGALNIEANVTNAPEGGVALTDLKAASTTDAEIWQYMQSVISPSFELGLDVSDAGSDTTQNAIFVAAALKDPGAKREIIESADRLTNGLFSQFFQNGEIARVQGRIPLGNYAAANGSRRDIRDASYLAVLNQFGQTDINTVRLFATAQWNPNIAESLRLSQQRQVINNMLSDVVYVDTATRIIFDHSFLGALARAIEAVGVSMQIQAPVTRQANPMYVPNINPNYNANDIMGGLFNQQYGNQMQGGATYHYSNRWAGVPNR